MQNEIITQEKVKITDDKKPFTSIQVTKKMLFIKNVGRLCKCGCLETVVGRAGQLYVNKSHKNKDIYSKYGKKPSSKTVQALVSINVNYDGTRNISLYFKRGVKRDIRISRNNCIDLWNTLNQISEFRNKPI